MRRKAVLAALGFVGVTLAGLTWLPAVTGAVDVSIASGSDDAEESPKGTVSLTSSDLELVTDGGKVQTVGLRFVGISIPSGATITSAYVQFQTDETSSDATSLTIKGEASDNPSGFTNSKFNVSSRPRTAASVSWSPAPWNVVGEAGATQRTPDLRAILQEIVARTGWSSGNAVAFIITGSGRRVAEAYDGSRAPTLHVEFDAAGPSPSPSASVTTSSSPTAPPTSTPTPTPTPSTTPAPSPSPTVSPLPGRTWRVPGDASTIQGGINLAATGDTVLVAPGTYRERPSISGKTITLASHFLTTGDPSYIAQTIIDGSGSHVLTIASNVGPQTRIVGLTIQNGDDGIHATGPFQLLNSRITNTSDGIDLTDVRGVVVRNSVIEGNSDDAIDFDHASDGIVEGNTLRSNGDDGIEIRLHGFSGPPLEIVIRNNIIDGNREDGIQLIDYDGVSARTFRITGNLIKGSTDAGIGVMCCGNTSENFSAWSMPEPVYVTNNTFVGNTYGITGGDAMTLRNNIFAGTTQIALKGVDGNSTVTHTLFWNNGTNYQSSNVNTASTLFADPLFDATYHLRPGSPAIDAGTDVGLPYRGAAPDLGAYETG